MKIVNWLLKIILHVLLPVRNLSKRNKRILFASSVVIILIMAPIIVYSLLHLGKVEAAWFDTNFSFRQRVDITNPGSAQTDFQISFILNTDTLYDNGKLRADCNDIRVTDTNGKLLPYWIEQMATACGNGQTAQTIWVKIPSIPTSGATLYVYYGNPQARAYSDGNKVFELFDDFSGSSINGATWSSSGSVSVGSSQVTFTSNPASSITSNKTFGVDHAMVFYGNLEATGYGTAGFGGVFFNYGTSHLLNWQGYTNTGSTEWTDTAGNRRWEIIRNSTTNNIFKVNGTTKATMAYVNSNAAAIGLSGTDTTGKINVFDFAFVRKTAASEPFVAYASGGTITQSGGYTIHTFTTSGTFTPSANLSVDALVVGGGGGGGGRHGGGGGGGGVRTGTLSVTSQAYTVTRGDGGTGAPYGGRGGNGGDSVFSTITSTGGGGGGGYSDGGATVNGNSGGSGGGGAEATGLPGGTGTYGAGNTPSTSPSQGNNGGVGLGNGGTNDWAGGGGGGAGAVGTNATASYQGGTGGVGVASSISGTSTYYGGGGGGAGGNNVDLNGGAGGNGGGGRGTGAYSPTQGVAGTANTGGGGGGSRDQAGPAGGSGIVIVRYLQSPVNEENGPGPIAYWKFDEGQGTSAKDSTTTGANGTLSGATLPAWQTKDQCVGEKCLFFDGSTSYVTTADKDFFSPSVNPISVSVWAKVPVGASASGNGSCGSTGRNLVAKGAASNWEWAIENDNNTLLCASAFQSTGSGHGFVSVSKTLNDGIWHHYEMVLTASTSIYLYIDGVLVASKTSSFTGSMTNRTQPVEIGRRGDGNYFAGYIDDVKMYNYARSAAQVKVDYNSYGGSGGNVLGAQNTRGDILSNDLVGYWKMDENTGTSASDGSGNSNTGTLASVNTTTTFYSDISDGGVYSQVGDYSTCRSTPSFAYADTDTTVRVGQLYSSGYYCWENFIKFNTSSIGSATISTATLNLTSSADSSTTDFTFQARISDWGATVTTADWVAGASLGGLTLVAHHATSDGWTVGTAYDFTDDALAANINKTGTTYLLLSSDRMAAGNTPTGAELADFYSADQTGTTQDPKLTVTYSTPGLDWTNGAKFNAAYDFESTNSEYSYAADSASLSITGSYTLGAWIKPESITASTLFDIAGKWDGSNESYLMAQYGDEIRCYVDSSSNYATTDAANLVTGAWYHVACAYDSVTSMVKIYINGQLTASTVTGTIPSSIGDDTGRFHIGAEDSTTTAANFYDGVIDEARVYNKALSPAEVQQIYNFAPSPVAYYNFEEGAGNSVNDTSGNANAGTWSGTGTTHWSSGKYGKAGNFNGTDDYVGITMNSPTTISGTYSVGAWFYKKAGNFPTIISPRSGSDNLSFQMQVRSKMFYVVGNGTSALVSTSGSANVSNNVWHYVACSVTTTGVNCYLDGALDLARTWASDTPLLMTPSYFVRIGQDKGHGSSEFNGYLDEVKIYNYARTSGQIVEDMNAGHPLGGSPVGSQMGYWKFDEGYGTNTSDSSLLKHNGTLSSGVSWRNDGKYGRGLFFNGAHYVTLGNISDYKIATRTASFWANPNTSFGATVGVISASSANWYVGFSTSGRMIMSYNNAAGTQVASYSDNNVTSTNSWHHYAYSMELTGADVTIKFYKDGLLEKTNTILGGGVSATYGSNFLLGSYATGSNFYSGLLDEIKLYNGILTTNEVKADMNRGASQVMGAMSDTSGLTGGNVASNSASAEYCVPGDTTSCAAPVLEWKMEERTGTSTNDTSGNGWTGTLTGSPSWISGKVGAGIRFNGSSTYITNASFNGLTTDTMSIWFKPASTVTSATACGTIFQLRDGGAGDYFDAQVGDCTGLITGETLVLVHDSGNGRTAITSNISATWHLLQVVWNSTASRYDIYLDGIAQTVTSGSTSHAGRLTDSNYARLGADNPGVSYFNGDMDQFRLFNYSRSAAQLAWDYNQGKPVGWWKFDECQGATAGDSSGNGNSGTVTIGGSGTQTSVGTCSTSGARYNGASGKYNYSLNFDGTDDYISAATILLPTVTASAWVYSTNFATNMFVVQKAPVNAEWELFFETTLKWRGGSTTSISCTAPSNNQWHHVAGTQTGTTATLYIDGVQCATGTVTAMPNGTGLIDIGRHSAGGYFFNGRIDDVRIYNYALTKQQVQQVYNQGSAIRYGPLTGSP